ncbi:MAG TPA: hypothetical protein VFK40_00905 [Nitrososphaeraceae archaeon]|nr:hypothetical protein [Nitrososphaeraceae archaeon]
MNFLSLLVGLFVGKYFSKCYFGLLATEISSSTTTFVFINYN